MANDLAHGKDPMKVNDPKFWIRAMLQSNGWGLGSLGQGIQNQPETQSTSEFAMGFAPPGISYMFQLTSALHNAYAKVVKGDIKGSKAEVIKWMMKNKPLGLVAVDLLYQRLVRDPITKMVDPRASSAFKRANSNLMKQTGQKFFWGPGQSKPRSPDLHIYGEHD